MTLVIELPSELKTRLEELAASNGQTADAFVLDTVVARLNAEPDPVQAQKERNRAAIELLRQWRSEPPDLEEAEGYATEISCFVLRGGAV